MSDILTIKKTICLEDFTSRLSTCIPSYEDGSLATTNIDGYTDWGKTPFDIIVSSEIDSVEQLDYSGLSSGTTYVYTDLKDLKDELPLLAFTGDNDSTDLVLRYKTMTRLYAQLDMLMRDCRYYWACKNRNGGYAWIELGESSWESLGVYKDVGGFENTDYNSDKFFAKDWNLYGYLPSDEEAEEAYSDPDKKYICVYDNMTWFTSHFRKENHNKRYDDIFFHFVSELINDRNSESIVKFREPFIPIEIFIGEKVKDIGLYKSDVQEWIPNKRYYIGDKVRYNVNGQDGTGNTYMLRGNNLYLYDLVEISDEIYEINSSYTDYYEERNGVTYHKAYYFKGYYDESKQITYFDNVDSNGNIIVTQDGGTTHWKKCVSNEQGSSVPIYGTDRSYLSNFESMVTSYDANDKPLPFLMVSEDNENTALKYLKGVVEDGDSLDYLRRVYFCDDEYNKTVATSDPVVSNDSAITDNTHYIEFEYYNGVSEVNSSIITSSAIKHLELYRFSVSDYAADVDSADTETYAWVELPDYDGSEAIDTYFLQPASEIYYGSVYHFLTENPTTKRVYDNEKREYVLPKYGHFYTCYPLFKYIDIDYDNTYGYSDLTGYFPYDGKVSRIEYAGAMVQNDMFQDTAIFTDDELMGRYEVKKDIDINVERGTSSATERHAALSEVNTMQDLENYKNDMFKIRQNNA